MTEEKCDHGRLATMLNKGSVQKAMSDPVGYLRGKQPTNKEGASSYRNPHNRKFLPVGGE